MAHVHSVAMAPFDLQGAIVNQSHFQNCAVLHTLESAIRCVRNGYVADFQGGNRCLLENGAPAIRNTRRLPDYKQSQRGSGERQIFHQVRPLTQPLVGICLIPKAM